MNILAKFHRKSMGVGLRNRDLNFIDLSFLNFVFQLHHVKNSSAKSFAYYTTGSKMNTLAAFQNWNLVENHVFIT